MEDINKTILSQLLSDPEQIAKFASEFGAKLSEYPTVCGALLGGAMVMSDANRARRKRQPEEPGRQTTLHRAQNVGGAEPRSTPWCENRGSVEMYIDASWADGQTTYETRIAIVIDEFVWLAPDQRCHLNDDDPHDPDLESPRTWTLPTQVMGPRGTALIHIHHRLKVERWNCAGIEAGTEPDADAVKHIYRVRSTDRTEIQFGEFLGSVVHPGETLEFDVDSPGSTRVGIMVFARAFDDDEPTDAGEPIEHDPDEDTAA